MDYISFRQALGQRINKIRKEKHLTQEKLAELINKTTEHISFIERGERSPSFEVLIDLSNAFDIPLSYLTDIDSDTDLDKISDIAIPAPVPIASLPDPVSDPIKPKEQLKSDLERLQEGFENIKKLEQLANQYGIYDILQDNGAKVLQILILLGLKVVGGREGNDAQDDEGNEYELKSVNVARKKNAPVTTHHHLTKEIIDKYRKVKAWCFAIYEDVELVEIWKVHPSLLESWFQEQEKWIDDHGGEARNNPKISLQYVKKGERVYRNPSKPEGPQQGALF